jgi:hypothetical protein
MLLRMMLSNDESIIMKVKYIFRIVSTLSKKLKYIVIIEFKALLSYRLADVCCTRGADKSLARPTSRCRRTESIVSTERGVCSCAELQVFSCYGG